LFPLFATGVVDTGGKFAASVIDIIDTGGKLPLSLFNNTSRTVGKIFYLCL
jgi:hypothetical protein